jgi:hypothetical protein
MNQTYAFIDEFGNHDLDTSKGGASRFFVLVAVLVSEEGLRDLETGAEEIRKKYFQTGEMKSSGVGNNHKRRITILKALEVLEFKFYSLVVDKDRINKDSGLQYKKSFLKHINGKLFNRIFSRFSDVHIIADEHGSDEYKSSFRSYIEHNHKPDMFYLSKFDLVQSKNNILVQLADFVVGSIAKVYEKKAPQELREEYLSLIKQRSVGIDEWPTKYQTYYPPDTTTDEFSQLILMHSLSSAELFIEENETRQDEDIRLQVAVARYLVFNSRWVNQEAYIATKVIQEHLLETGYGKIAELKLRSSIIAKLRDRDVIISSSNKGYKIPCCFQDMKTFVETVNGKIKPLLERLGKARSSLHMASKGEIDILKGPDYTHLVSFIEILDKSDK